MAGVVRRTVPVLRFLKRLFRPRWPTPFEATKRVVGFIVLLLGASLLAPIPLSNLPPALLIVLIAFAYLEEDGVLLCAALSAALIMFALLGAAVVPAVFQGCYRNRLGFATRHTLNVTCSAAFPSEEIQ